jgi:hypothetical protein
VTGNSIVDVPLDRAPASSGNKRKGSSDNGNGLMNPDDL